MLIGPALIAIGLLYQRFGPSSTTETDTGVRRGSVVPPFVVAFALVAVVNSLGLVPSGLVDPAYDAARFLILIAVASLGLQASVRQMRAVGLSPLYAGMAIAAGLSVVALVLSIYVG
jgi:uncharacterized membrane protein YadS